MSARNASKGRGAQGETGNPRRIQRGLVVHSVDGAAYKLLTLVQCFSLITMHYLI